MNENNEKILKPMSVAIEDFKKGITDLINNSNIPVFIIEPILKNYLYEISNATKKQVEFENNLYNEKLKKQKEPLNNKEESK